MPCLESRATASCTPRRTAGEDGIGPESSHHATRRITGCVWPIAVTASRASLRSSTHRARKPARGLTAVRPGIVAKAPPSPRAADRGTRAAIPQA